MGEGNVPPKMEPTSSIVNNLPTSGALPSTFMPPNQPQKRIAKMTFWTSLLHMPLYLFPSASAIDIDT